MWNIFRKTKAETLQLKYDKLMKEAYDLSMIDPELSFKKQKEAHEVQKELITL